MTSVIKLSRTIDTMTACTGRSVARLILVAMLVSAAKAVAR